MRAGAAWRRVRGDVYLRRRCAADSRMLRRCWCCPPAESVIESCWHCRRRLPASAASAMLLAVGTCGRISELSVLLGLLMLSVHTRGVRSGDESSRCAAP